MTKKKAMSDPQLQEGFPDAHDILMHAPIGVFTSTPQGRFVSVNLAMAQMYGYQSSQEYIGAIADIAAQTYADPADRKELQRLLEEQGEVINHECRMVRRDAFHRKHRR